MEKIIIDPHPTGKNYFKELWRYRELFYFLAWRDILVRYKQTSLGVAWSVLRPLLMMAIFTAVFNKIAGLSSGNIPYPLMVFAALMPWHFFSNSVQASSDSLLVDTQLIAKVYFPRLVIPTSAMVVTLVDFVISAVLFVFLMLGYGVWPDGKIVFFPVFLLMAVLCALGIGYWFSALNVKYRDFRYIIPFVLQVGMYISPVGFNSAVVPEKWRLIFSLNPMVGVIDGFRFSLLGEGFALYWPGLILSAGLTLVIFVSGYLVFIRKEREFADII